MICTLQRNQPLLRMHAVNEYFGISRVFWVPQALANQLVKSFSRNIVMHPST